jgi:hypothetical protein
MNPITMFVITKAAGVALGTIDTPGMIAKTGPSQRHLKTGMPSRHCAELIAVQCQRQTVIIGPLRTTGPITFSARAFLRVQVTADGIGGYQ